MRVAAGIEYRGSGYLGWQRQESGTTVQQLVESALSSVANESVTVHCAGRTDTGVHALAQVVHFETTARREPHEWVFGANVNLPADISVLWARPVPDEFHARFSAVARTYRYLILNRRSRPGVMQGLVTWEPRPLELAAMGRAAACLVGKHDFTSFRASGCQARSPVREVRRLNLERSGEMLTMEVEANAFLHHMVRNIAGALMDVGTGKRPIEWVPELLAGRDRAAGGVTASADGLYLAAVKYPDIFKLPSTAGETGNPHPADAPSAETQ